MLSTEKARDLLRDVQFPGEEDATHRIAVSGKLKRRAAIRADAGDRDRETAAAVEIQRVWRGFRTRRKYTSIVGRHRQDRGGGTKRFPLLKQRYREYVEWCSSALGVSENSNAVSDFKDYCARVIQLWWRMVKIGGEGEQGSHKITKRRILTEQEAAKKIQGTWKSYQNKKTFKFYQKLIDFKDKGDPSVMLRSINPTEAKLLDKASGACVRFRLGGSQFPPGIYYKIFTSQVVVDVCSYSPRDYTAMSARRQLQRDIHNHGGRSVVDDGSNWYKRWENNGWRLVSERFFQSRLQDSLTLETSAKRQPFHHSKLQRRADVERKRRKKKMEWMKKLYQPRVQRVPSAENDDLALDGEVDELLEWSHGLSYDDYVTDWSQTATSAVLHTPCDSHHYLCSHQPTTATALT